MEMPMTPQAGRVPALPVFLDSGWSVLPRSSVPEWTTTVRLDGQHQLLAIPTGPRGRKVISKKKGKTHADDAILSNELDQLISHASLRVTLAVGLEVAQVADVAVVVGGSAVVLVVGVDFWTLATDPTHSDSQSTGCKMKGEENIQCGPADVHPLVLSPKACTCMPRSAFASCPLMFHEMVVGADSSACSKVTVPFTLESPRRTATVCSLASIHLSSICPIIAKEVQVGTWEGRVAGHQGLRRESSDWIKSSGTAANRRLPWAC